ncbi:hypothetical protein SS37A_35400 (plasmid) [Methylocystis iwaonis]|uniref:Uncharacterized protein n=1 Tax=Methylocystis iwaonis TaxID=2885079 RepID=A0ABM8EDB8_9HYPH|nr:hypothetical protein SS37A_35400 [Methylocystis iwaonis]
MAHEGEPAAATEEFDERARAGGEINLIEMHCGDESARPRELMVFEFDLLYRLQQSGCDGLREGRGGRAIRAEDQQRCSVVVDQA